MRSKLATKISVAIVGVVVLAISSSVVALLSTWHIGGLMQDTVTENLSSLRAAEELEIALLETTARVQYQVIRVTWVVAVFASLTIGLGALLAWLFFHGVLNPLQRMVADARKFTGQRSVTSVEMPMDELPAIDAYLHSLMCVVSGSR